MSTSDRPSWPWPEDTPTDRARKIANSLLHQLPQEQREHAIRQARAVGETWLGAELLRWDTDDVVTTGQAAELLHVKPWQIRLWHSREGLANAGERGRYRVGTLLDFAADRRSRRGTLAGVH